LKNIILAFVFWGLTPILLIAHWNPISEFDRYKNLNTLENRLQEFADSDSALFFKVRQLQIINESRLKYKCEPVQLDILACRVANKMAKDAAEGGYVGHWNRAGEKPYQRWSFAGGKDHVAENAYGEWSSAKYKNNWFTIDSLMQAGHKAFITEKHPNDGHKQNILNKSIEFFIIWFHFCLRVTIEFHFKIK